VFVISLFATTLELLPERIDIVSFVLQMAGLLGLVGTAVAVRARRRLRPRPDDRPLAERYTLLGAIAGIVLFLGALLLQEVD